MTTLKQSPRQVLLRNQDRRCPFCGSSRLMMTQGTTAARHMYTTDTQFSCCGCGDVFGVDELDCISDVAPPRPEPASMPKRPKPPTRYRIQCGCGAEFHAVVSQQVAAACPWCDLRYRIDARTGLPYSFRVESVAQADAGSG